MGTHLFDCSTCVGRSAHRSRRSGSCLTPYGTDTHSRGRGLLDWPIAVVVPPLALTTPWLLIAALVRYTSPWAALTAAAILGSLSLGLYSGAFGVTKMAESDRTDPVMSLTYAV